jgi:hypothetical protein
VTDTDPLAPGMRSRAFLSTRPRTPELQLPVTAGRLPGRVGQAPIASTVSAMTRLRQPANFGGDHIVATRDGTPPGGGSATAVVGDQAGFVPES